MRPEIEDAMKIIETAVNKNDKTNYSNKNDESVAKFRTDEI